MKLYDDIKGVPAFEEYEIQPKQTKYCLCIPIINENGRIQLELERALKHKIHKVSDIIICDGGSTDGSIELSLLKELKVNTLLIKKGPGKQGAQLRMGFWWALARGYAGIITVDGNNKDSVESVPLFIKKLEEGYDFVQGSRYIEGGEAVNTPWLRNIAVKHIHAPLVSRAAGHKFSDTTNAFRGHSKEYLEHPGVKPFRDIFTTYELLAYLSIRVTQLGLKACEVPVKRSYPVGYKTPTKISFMGGNLNLIVILIKAVLGYYEPENNR